MPHIPAGYVNVQLIGTNAAGQEWLTACGSIAEAWDPGEVLAPFPGFLGSSGYADQMTSDCTMTELRAVLGTSDPSAPITYTWTGSVVGGSASGAVPSAAWLLRKGTNRGGRKGRGRCFMPGPTEGGVSGAGRLVGDLATDPSDLTEFWPDLLEYMGLGPAQLLHTDEVTEPDPITVWNLDQLVATQRRRLR